MVETAVALFADPAEVPVKDTRIEALLTDWKLPFELDEQYPLAKLNIEDTAQIRNAVHRAPTSTVEEYVTHMKHGAVFPPIVVTQNGILVDGNTRVAAARRLKQAHFPAYKVRFAHLGLAKMIGAALNQMGGDRLTTEEINDAAEVMMREGFADEAIARTLGRSPSHVRDLRKDSVYRDALSRTGLDDPKLPKQLSRALAGIKHDEPFRAAVQIVQKAKPSLRDAYKLVETIDKTRSDADALAKIREAETAWGIPQGPPPERKSLSRSRAKKALGLVKQLVDFDAAPAELVMPDQPDAQAAWQRLNSLTTTVLSLYAHPPVAHE